ncbi:hypothetical protein BaRGS_00012901 [Batillaria attramentaria]|uniref:Mediator of RNA polymerase II transcription subunit 26 n=1 Tax=Batillaria attramentaria TaxID=370345 RepID=A0ABD0L8N2_9CAEN
MLPTPLEIKEKLLKALNGENNVVDDKAVLEVISILEKYPITRTTLEQTRIGKTVNELRKKIKDEKLAKRAKQLVRSWKNILDGTATVVNGERPSHPAVAALQLSPAVSPALSRTPPPHAGRGTSPALARTPVTLGSRSASPALSASGKPLTPALAKPRLASPALASSRPGTASPLIAQRVASPALPGSKPRTPLLPSTSRVASPVVDYSKARIRPPSASSSPALSPASRPSTPGAPLSRRDGDALRSSGKDKSRVGSGRDDVSGSGRATPTGRLTPSSLYSENSQDRVLGDRGNGAVDSDCESNSNFSRSSHGGSFNHRNNNHSAGVSSLSKSSNKGSSSKDQRDLSKANVANRKRTREHSQSPPEVSSKQSKLEPSGLSVNRHERAVNGCVKSGKKVWPGAESLPRVSSTCSLPANVGRVSSPKSPFAAGNGDASSQLADSLLRQESTDSRLSAQSFDRPSRDKHKVKTTEQLIEELQKKNNSSRVGASVINDLRTNQIEKERDVQGSVLPPGVKPRGRKGKRGKDDDIQLSVPSSDVTLSQAKNELVERFLETSDPSSTVEEYSPFKDDLLSQRSDSVLEPGLGLGAHSGSFSKDSFDSGFPTVHRDSPRPTPVEQKAGDRRPQSTTVPDSQSCGAGLSLQEIYAQLPPVDDDIDWDAVDYYELPEPEPVTDELVDRLHNTQWPGVNGFYDINGEWHRLHETMTFASYQGDMLHVLPYVDLD